MKPDWNKIELDYYSGMKPDDIIKKYNIKRGTFDARVNKGDWKSKKQVFISKTQVKLEEKVSGTLSDRQAKFLERQYKLSEKILNRLEVEFDNSEKLMDLSTAVNSLREGIKIGRQSINLFDSKAEVNITKPSEQDAIDNLTKLFDEYKPRNPEIQSS